MTEFVVYEDTPFAEYLNSIEISESPVKLAPVQRNRLNAAAASVRWVAQWSETLYQFWRRSLFHDTFSVSLPLAEETAFEENFKYIIVTSPLLSETLSVHNANKKKQKHAAPHMTTDYSTPTTKVSRTGSIGSVATIAGLLAALGTETFLVHGQQPQSQALWTTAVRLLSKPTISLTTLLTGTLSIFFVYRHMHRAAVRQLYETALQQLQLLMEQCEALDSKTHRALMTIQEIELVSRGYRLSTPLSPISRIEQTAKSRRCVTLRNRLAAVLRRAFIVYEEAIIDLIEHVNKSNLSRLYDMYNVRSIASLSAVDRMDENESEATAAGTSLERLRALAQLMHAKRRECMMQLLALDIMSEGHDSVRRDYEKGWKAVNSVLATLAEETRKFVGDVVDALGNELYKPSLDHPSEGDSTDFATVSDSRLKQFVHRLASLDQQVRTLEAKFYLCNDNIRQFTSGTTANWDATNDDLRERLKRDYMSIQQDFNQMVVEWEAGRDALLSFLEPPELDPSPSSSTSTPVTPHKDRDDTSLLPSPATDGQENHQVYDAEDSAVFDLPLPAKASVFEAVAEVVERHEPGRSKMSRAERIAKMKAEREEQARKKAKQMDSQSMVHELKNVLDRRVTELQLGPEEAEAVEK